MKRTQAEIIEKLKTERNMRVLVQWADGTVNMANDEEMIPVSPDGKCAGYNTLEECDSEV
jgi:hypothetical protein